MGLQTLDISARSATTTPPPGVRKSPELAKLIDISKCIGCKACQVACMEWNDLRDSVGVNVGSYDNPVDLSAQSWTVMRYTEVESAKGKLEWLIRKDGCMHCSEPGCLKACPAPGAIVRYSNGIVDYHQEHCTGCGYCIIGCPFNIPRISAKDGKAYKCTLCSDRVAVGSEPACSKTCPTKAIVFGTKDDMLSYAATRVEEIKKRGFDKAGIYNPPGVGGTHVLYVLPHADTPELYHGLPKNPEVSPLVAFWKGTVKTIINTGLTAAVLAAFFHYVVVGPNSEEHKKEDAA